MADKLDYALLANRVYDRPNANKIQLPDDWQGHVWNELAWYDDDLITGFSAGVYERDGEIVISFISLASTIHLCQTASSLH